MQVIDLLSNELSQDTISLTATRRNTKVTGLHFKLNFFIL
jgi:hypothetical protein